MALIVFLVRDDPSGGVTFDYTSEPEYGPGENTQAQIFAARLIKHAAELAKPTAPRIVGPFGERLN